jgi:protein-ribulosamine 3-kinase
LIGEFESLKAIHSLLPGFVPEAIAQGSYASNPDVHFLLMGFLDLTGDVPDVDSLPAKLAEMHLKGVSSNGKFGFHLPSGLPYLQGDFEQPNTWTSSWETLFTTMYVRIFDWEQCMHGEDEEMRILFKSMVEKVIPRLLRPLETGGNQIRASLLHGDLWDGNTGTDAATEEPLIFDATSFYGHNECMLTRKLRICFCID